MVLRAEKKPHDGDEDNENDRVRKIVEWRFLVPPHWSTFELRYVESPPPPVGERMLSRRKLTSLFDAVRWYVC